MRWRGGPALGGSPGLGEDDSVAVVVAHAGGCHGANGTRVGPIMVKEVRFHMENVLPRAHAKLRLHGADLTSTSRKDT